MRSGPFAFASRTNRFGPNGTTFAKARLAMAGSYPRGTGWDCHQVASAACRLVAHNSIKPTGGDLAGLAHVESV